MKMINLISMQTTQKFTLFTQKSQRSDVRIKVIEV